LLVHHPTRRTPETRLRAGRTFNVPAPIGGRRMKPLVIVGVILVVLGIVALAVPSFTFFTTERVADAGFFKIDVSKPHTVVLNPIVGIVAVVAGIVLVILGRRPASP
jgi:uncharacterized membrane protein HdeD (DUF308 family)